MKIKLQGWSKELRVAVKFNKTVMEPKHWIVTVIASKEGRRIVSEELSIYYSEILDTDYVNLEAQDSNSWMVLKPIKSSSGFDTIELGVVKLPWAPSTDRAETLTIVQLNYAARSVALSERSKAAHVLGKL